MNKSPFLGEKNPNRLVSVEGTQCGFHPSGKNFTKNDNVQSLFGHYRSICFRVNGNKNDDIYLRYYSINHANIVVQS